MADPQTRRAGDNPLPSPLRPGGEFIRRSGAIATAAAS